MERIRANVRYNEYNNRLYYRDFQIYEKAPEVGDIIGGEDVISVSPIKLDAEQPKWEVYDYDYYRVETTCNGENNEDDNIVLWVAVKKEDDEEDCIDEDEEEDEES